MFHRCHSQSNWSNLHCTINAALALWTGMADWRMQTKRSLEKTNCIQGSWTICIYPDCLSWTGWRAKGCDWLRSLWRRRRDLLSCCDRYCIPNKNRSKEGFCDRSRNRRNEPAWLRPTCRQREQWTCQTGYFWHQSTLGQYSAWSMGLKKRLWVRKFEWLLNYIIDAYVRVNLVIRIFWLHNLFGRVVRIGNEKNL